MEVYSVDESFLDLRHVPGSRLYQLAADIRTTVEQWTGVAVSVGVAVIVGDSVGVSVAVGVSVGVAVTSGVGVWGTQPPLSSWQAASRATSAGRLRIQGLWPCAPRSRRTDGSASTTTSASHGMSRDPAGRVGL